MLPSRHSGGLHARRITAIAGRSDYESTMFVALIRLWCILAVITAKEASKISQREWTNSKSASLLMAGSVPRLFGQCLKGLEMIRTSLYCFQIGFR
jgi:hypothetical protein